MTSLRRSLSPSIYDRPLQNGTTFLDASLPIAATVPNFNPGFPAAAAATLSLADVSSNGRNYWMADKLKFKGNLWKKPFMHVILCFILGCLVGLTPFSVPKPAMYKPMAQLAREAKTHVLDKANSFGDRERHSEVRDPPTHSDSLKVMTSLLEQAAHGHQMSDPALSKLLIVVTPTYNRPLQAMYLTRLSHTLKLVPPPLLWLVVEMGSQTVETATLLRNTGLMYRHLVCDKNTSDIKDRGVHQRNVALAHIERHQLDGVVYFADDDNVYTLELFQQMRTIKRFGTWPIAMLTHNKSKTILEGPVCDGHKVIGWHTNEKSKRLRRFHVDMSGFAFNSTILWDPQRWRKPSLEPIRQMDNIKEGFQETTFIEQLVEDESQMEGLPVGCSKVMVWHVHLEAPHLIYPSGWRLEQNLPATISSQ